MIMRLAYLAGHSGLMGTVAEGISGQADVFVQEEWIRDSRQHQGA
jgi:hypothetical protein